MARKGLRPDPAGRSSPRTSKVRVAGLVALALLAGCGPEPEPPRRTPRVLVVGWDGASFTMIDKLVAQGRLPVLADLAKRGFSARLESTLVPISSAAWTAMTTGRHPGQTGVYGFFEPVPGTYDVELVSSRSSRATPIWRTLSRRGLTSLVFGVPVTYPPEPILGVMVAGMLSPFDAVYTWPPELAGELRDRGFVPDLGMWRSEAAVGEEARVVEQVRLKQQVVTELLEREDWSLAWVVFKSLDVVSHRAYDGKRGGTVARLYEELDSVLGGLIRAAGRGSDVLVVSDHGFRRYSAVLQLDTWLVRSGFAVRKEEGAAAGPLAGPLAESRAIEHRRRMQGFDLAQTRAWTAIAEGNTAGIRLNLQGREPRGVVPADQRPAVLAELRAALGELRGPGGVRIVRRTVLREQLYPGPYAGGLPDLLIETHPAIAVSAGGNAGSTLVGVPEGGLPEHDRAGVWIGAGPNIAARERGDARVFDVAPTVLALLGLPLYENLAGSPYTRGLLDPGPFPRVREDRDPPDVPERVEWLERGAQHAEAQRRAVRERLRALGYVE